MSTKYTLKTGEEITLSDDLLAEVRELKMLHPGVFRGLTLEQVAVSVILVRRAREGKATP
jgi:hypothetical protein